VIDAGAAKQQQQPGGGGGWVVPVQRARSCLQSASLGARPSVRPSLHAKYPINAPTPTAKYSGRLSRDHE